MRLYLDIDGTVNAFHSQEEWGTDTSFGADDIAGYSVMWSKEMITRLKNLAREYPALELVWVTGWGADCRDVARAIGLGKWGTQARWLSPSSGAMTYPSVYWKAESIWEDLKTLPVGERWAWLSSGVAELVSDEYRELLYEMGGYVPVLNERWGIGKLHLTEIDLICATEEEEAEVGKK